MDRLHQKQYLICQQLVYNVLNERTDNQYLSVWTRLTSLYQGRSRQVWGSQRCLQRTHCNCYWYQGHQHHQWLHWLDTTHRHHCQTHCWAGLWRSWLSMMMTWESMHWTGSVELPAECRRTRQGYTTALCPPRQYIAYYTHTIIIIRSTQPGHPFVGRHSEHQPNGGDALQLRVKVGMVRVWVAGQTVWSPRYTRPLSERLSSGASHNNALYKSSDYSYSYHHHHHHHPQHQIYEMPLYTVSHKNAPLCTNSAFHPSRVGKSVPASAGKAKAGMVHSVSGWTRGVQVKLRSPENACNTWAP